MTSQKNATLSDGKTLKGAPAVDALCRRGGGLVASRPTLMLDLDDVLCLNQPYGGYEVFSPDERPLDLWERLWHEPAKQVLIDVMNEFGPRVVLTTSWLRMAERPAFETMFRLTGLDVVASSFHPQWEAPGLAGVTRHGAIERWLHAHYEGEPLVILDDELSGTGLQRSRLDRAGCVVLCKRDVGLHFGHMTKIRRALRTPPKGGDANPAGIRRDRWRA